MLTSLFYYDHYRPYIVKTADSRYAKTEAQKRRPVFSEDDAPADVALNKSLNKDVINYAKSIYRNTTDLKYSSKKLASDMRNYSKYKDRSEFDQDIFERNFEDDLEQFSNAYNKSVSFLKNQQHSPYLGEAAERLNEIVDGNGELLSAMGVAKDESGNLSAKAEENTFWSEENIKEKSEAAESFFTEIYNETTEILDNPMSKHMNFKSLNYYYNYQVDKVHVDSFQIIKTGLLVNLAL